MSVRLMTLYFLVGFKHNRFHDFRWEGRLETHRRVYIGNAIVSVIYIIGIIPTTTLQSRYCVKAELIKLLTKG